MVQLKLLSGIKAGTVWVARRFPVRVGRGANNDLRIEEDGVWDQHFSLSFKPREGIWLKSPSQGVTRVNGEAIQEVLLRNGDLIEIGALKLQFWLNETRQRGFRLREALTWCAIVGMSLGQVALVYWLLR
jgi:hypothetical protein